MTNLYLLHQDIKNTLDIIKILKETDHTFYGFPPNSTLGFIKKLIAYPENKIYNSIIIIIPVGTQVSIHFKDYEIYNIHNAVIIRYG